MALVGHRCAQGATTCVECRFKTGMCVLQSDPRCIESESLKAISSGFMSEVN